MDFFIANPELPKSVLEMHMFSKELSYEFLCLWTGSALNFSRKLRLDVKIGQLMRTENF